MFPFEFIIQAISVSCTSCNEVFATQIPFKMPEMTITLPVEADLHRVLPHGAIRSCLVTICPKCQYTWWTNTFSRHFFLPVGIPETPSVDHARKFAHAVLTGRKCNYHILDRALLAINGYWCAKETHQETSKWLTLSIQELSSALANENWQGNRARYYYLLGELCRLNSQFTQAIQAFALVDTSANLPETLIQSQKTLANTQNSDPVLLSNDQVQQIFFPKMTSIFDNQAEKEQIIEQNPSPQLVVNNSFSMPPQKRIKTAV